MIDALGSEIAGWLRRHLITVEIGHAARRGVVDVDDAAFLAVFVPPVTQADVAVTATEPMTLDRPCVAAASEMLCRVVANATPP